MPSPPTPPARAQLAQQLQQLPFFAGLDGAAIATLADAARWATYAAGAPVVLEGDAARGVFYLHSGWLKIVKTTAGGREQTLRFLAPGDTFNEIGVFTDQPTPATAIALEPAAVWLIPRATLLHLLRTQPAFAEQLVARLAERLLYLVNLVSDLSLHTVADRLTRLLLEDADAHGRLARPRWYTQAELAARLGSVPDVVQRALRDLEAAGLIEVARHEIRILDRAALAARVA